MGDSHEEIAALVKTLQETQQRLQELTGGEVDAVLFPGGQAYMLQEAQGKLRESEVAQRKLAETMIAILNALPAHIALLDAHGTIISVNDIWRRSVAANTLAGSTVGVEQNYLEICEKARGDGAETAREVAAGIRQVLSGAVREFSREYPCHSPTQQRWFSVTVTPVGGKRPSGAVVMHLDITARKLADEKMRESEERFRSLFNAAATGIATSTPQGRYLQANAAYCRMLGYTEEELRQRDFASLTHPDDLGLNLKMRDEMLSGERESFAMEKRYLKKNGEIVWTRHSVSATHTPEGKIAMLIVVAEDITESKLAGEALQVAASSLAVSQRIAHLGSWEMDLVHPENLRANPLRWSDELYRILGYLPQSIDVTPDFYLSHVSEEEGALIIQRLEALLHDGEPHSYFYPITRSDGERRIFQSEAQVLPDEKTGKPLKLIGTLHDVTELKDAEEQLLWKTALLEAQLSSSLDGIFIVDTQGQKVLQNQRMVDLWNIPAALARDPDIRPQREWTANCTKNPREFLEKIAYLYDHPDEVSNDEIELVNGRIFDRYSAPVRDANGNYYGRIWNYRDVTERKRAEVRAAEQLKLIDMASRVAKLGAWAIEFPGPHIVWSEQVYRIHEVEADFKPDLTAALNFFPGDSRKRLLAAIRSKQPFDLELDFITAKGNRRSVRTTSAVEMQNGEVSRLYGIFQDVSDRIHHEARVRRLIDSNVQGVCFWDKQGKITEANDSFLQFVGYTREDLEAGAISWTAMTPPEYAEADRRAFREIDTGGACKPYEKEYIRKDGSHIAVLVGAATFEDRPDEGVCFVLDLTEQRKSRARLRRLVDSNVQGILFWNKTGEITDANDYFLNLIHRTREDLEAGRINWKDMTPPEYAHLDQGALEQIAATGTCVPYEKEFVLHDGTRVPVLLGSTSFEDSPEEGVCFILNLTEQKKLEHQFLRAQRMESIGTLAGGIAHDLNNILAPIMMSVQILKFTATDPQAKSILETIEVSSKRGADIVRQVLSFARGVEGERVEIQPKHLLKDIETIIRDTFPKNITRDIATSGESWTVSGDPTQLHQILLNLCVNARDAMPDGGVLTVTVENMILDHQYAGMNIEAKPGRYVTITVTDTGMGIPPGIVDKIFDPFFTTKEVGKGTGLGLSTVMAIVKSHGGFVNVYSEVGKGSRFSVYLPALESAAPASKGTGPLTRLSRGKGELVLIIDDETSILAVTSQTLEAFGYRTLIANDGAEAVAIYAQQKDTIAVVLTDMAMPIMDGTATIRALMKINPAAKIIAATGLKTDGSEAKAAQVGVRHFLAKPYTAGTLLKTLRMVLDGRENGKAAPRDAASG